MYYVLITDKNGNENRLKARTWDEVLLFVKVHKGKIREFKFKRKWQNGGKIMFWNPQLEEIEKPKERLKEAYAYYEVKTYEKPKRTRKFYKNYISRRNKWESLLVFLNYFS